MKTNILNNQSLSVPVGHTAQGGPVIDNQRGSVIVFVLMVLVALTVIGIVSSDTVITEKFIVRNVGIHKQNASLVDSALMIGLQQVMQLDNNDGDNFDPDAVLDDWLNNDDTDWTAGTADWYEASFTDRCLDGNNSRDANSANNLPLMDDRGENALPNLRYAVVGWGPLDFTVTGGSTSLVVGSGPVWHSGQVIAEYVSEDAGGDGNGFGLIRGELGVRQLWVD